MGVVLQIKMEDKIKKGFLIVLVSVLASMGTTITSDYTVNQAINELDGFYICDSTQQVLEFVRISSTKVTGYPYLESNVGRIICEDLEGVNGQWYTLQDYAILNEIGPYTLLIQPTSPIEGWGQQYLCDNIECKLK